MEQSDGGWYEQMGRCTWRVSNGEGYWLLFLGREEDPGQV